MKTSILFLAFCVPALSCAGGEGGKSSSEIPVGPPVAVVPGYLLDGIRYSGELQVLESHPVQLVGSVTMENTTATTARAMFDRACLVGLVVYGTTPDPETPSGVAVQPVPVWDQQTDPGCEARSVELSLAPGERRRLDTGRAGAAEILAEHPDGRYLIQVRVFVAGAPVELSLDYVDLSIPR